MIGTCVASRGQVTGVVSQEKGSHLGPHYIIDRISGKASRGDHSFFDHFVNVDLRSFQDFVMFAK